MVTTYSQANVIFGDCSNIVRADVVSDHQRLEDGVTGLVNKSGKPTFVRYDGYHTVWYAEGTPLSHKQAVLANHKEKSVKYVKVQTSEGYYEIFSGDPNLEEQPTLAIREADIERGFRPTETFAESMGEKKFSRGRAGKKNREERNELKKEKLRPSPVTSIEKIKSVLDCIQKIRDVGVEVDVQKVRMLLAELYHYDISKEIVRSIIQLELYVFNLENKPKDDWLNTTLGDGSLFE